MNYYISYLHFGHANVIGFDNRPFTDVDEMDRFLIDMRNARVRPEDNVYIVGDFSFRTGRNEAYHIMKKLDRAVNAACCINNYMPATLDELIRNNEAFKAQEGGDLE